MMKKIAVALLLMMICSTPAWAASIYQDSNRFAYGVKRLIGAPFQIPVQMIQGTVYGPFLVGTVTGALRGTFSTVGDLAGGAFDMAAAASPYAKYALLF